MRNPLRFLYLSPLLIAGALGFSSIAHADTINFSYTGTGVDVIGTFTTTAPVDGVYTVTGITGTRNGQAITGLDPAGSYQSNDNTLTLNSPFVSLSGISYDVSGTDYNIFFDNGTFTPINGNGECSNCGNDFIAITFNDSLVPPAVPEPSSIFLLGTGIIGFAGATRRRFIRS
jgi:hypothetical protein